MAKAVNTRRRRLLANTSALAALTVLDLVASAKSFAGLKMGTFDGVASTCSFGTPQLTSRLNIGYDWQPGQVGVWRGALLLRSTLSAHVSRRGA
jgi:hypothetical protein